MDELSGALSNSVDPELSGAVGESSGRVASGEVLDVDTVVGRDPVLAEALCSV